MNIVLDSGALRFQGVVLWPCAEWRFHRETVHRRVDFLYLAPAGFSHSKGCVAGV
jgi:hypothetical protein